MNKNKISVVLVEDHAIVRTSLRTILEESGDFHVVAEAADGAEGVRLCRARSPQLVLMDMSMPVLNGLDATMELARHCPEVRVVVLSAYLEHPSGKRLLSLRFAGTERQANAHAQAGGGVIRRKPPAARTAAYHDSR